MTDIERMHGTFGLPQTELDDRTILSGMAPVSTMRITRRKSMPIPEGTEHCNLTLKGYAPCHNTEEVLAATGYDSERIHCIRRVPYSVRMEQVFSFRGTK